MGANQATIGANVGVGSLGDKAMQLTGASDAGASANEAHVRVRAEMDSG